MKDQPGLTTGDADAGILDPMSIDAATAAATAPAPDSATLELAPAVEGRVNFGCTMQSLVTTAPLILMDVVAITWAVLAAMLVTGTFLSRASPIFLIYFLPLVGVSLVVYAWSELYPGVGMHPSVELRQIWMAASQVVGLLSVLILASRYHDFGPWHTELTLLLAAVICLVTVPASRVVARPWLGRISWWGHPVLIFGSGPTGMKVWETLRKNPGMGLRPVGVIDELHAHWKDNTELQTAYLGTPEETAELSRKHRAYWGVVALPESSRDKQQRVIDSYASCLPHLLVVTDFGVHSNLWSQAKQCAGMQGIHVKERLLLPLPQLVKRIQDMLLTALGSVLIVPLVGVISLVAKLTSRGPIFYSQERIGYGGKKFMAWKFRTMVENGDEVLRAYLAAHPELQDQWDRFQKLQDDPRVTFVGKFLRKTSLDELPQIWNVVRGEMSLVGPRPMVESQIPLYGPNYCLYKKMRPGITGLWQISGRNKTTFQQRADFDAYYIRNWSPWFDLYILIYTVRTVLLGEGAY